MRKIVRTITFSLLVCTSAAFAAEEGLVKQAAKQCEEMVTQHCIEVNCPAYCSKIFESRRNNEQLIEDCKKDCTKDKRCLLKPIGGKDDPKNAELDAQNRDQLIACIAQVRDPEGTKTGRRMKDWKDLKTPSWEKLFEPKKKLW